MTELPKYVQEANRVMTFLSEQPDREWRDTQRELASRLDIAQSIMSLRLKLLEDHGRIQRVKPLPVRGRNFVIELIDDTPFTTSVPPQRHPDDRALEANESPLPGVVQFERFSPELVGIAVVQTIQEMWRREEDLRRQLQEQELAARTFRNRMEEEVTRAEMLDQEKEALALELEQTRGVARRLNQRISEMNRHQGRTLDDESARILDVLKG